MVVLELGNGTVKPDAAADMALGATLRAYRVRSLQDQAQGGRRGAEQGAADARRRRRCRRRAQAPGAAGRRWLTASCSRATSSTSRRTCSIRSSSRAAPRACASSASASRSSTSRRCASSAWARCSASGRARARDSRLVVMRWNGGKKGTPPVAFIGKGVCFDTGGISIKPAAGMEDMKGDMAGRGLRRRADARARRPQGQGQRDRRDRPGREHAGRQCAAARRHRHLDVRPDHRDHQHRRRRPARARRRGPLHQHASSSRNSWSISRR